MTLPLLPPQDAELQRDMLALLADPTSPDAQSRVTGAVDHWLLRTSVHRVEAGRQILTWFVDAAQAVDPAAAGTGRAILEALGVLYQCDLSAVAKTLKSGSSWTYDRYVSGPNPRDALKESGKKGKDAWELMTAAGTILAGDADFLADGKALLGGFWYYIMPLRAAFMRAVLAGWAKIPALEREHGEAESHFNERRKNAPVGVIERLADLGAAGHSTIPATKLSVSPRFMLALVLTEALDDDTAKDFVEDAPGDAYARKCSLTAAGRKLKEIIRAKLQPPSGFGGSDAEAALARYSAELRDVRVAAVSAGAKAVIRDAKLPPFDAIIVPGYTALPTLQNPPTISKVGVIRLRKAIEDFEAGYAPFIVVSGANVYPLGTHLTEAKFMYDWLTDPSFRESEDDKRLAVIPADRVIAEARARHSTTNLRNASRILLGAGLEGPYLVTTGGDEFIPKETAEAAIAAAIQLGIQATAELVQACNFERGGSEQDRELVMGIIGTYLASAGVMAGVVVPLMQSQAFYFQTPWWSQYNSRCDTELGYRPHHFVGDPSEFQTYAESGPYGANSEPTATLDALPDERRPRFIQERLKARYEMNKDVYQSLSKDMHAVMVPALRLLDVEWFNVRDPFDP
ncbi:MAG: YdcF family protein [Polyangiaceae bacterium]